jgi:HSP20 family protein
LISFKEIKMSDKPMMNQEQGAMRKEINKNQVRWVSPTVNIYEVDDNLILQANLPGVEEAGLDLQVSRGVLTLEAVIDIESDERQTGFYRQFKLSDRIDADGGDAALKDGVLTLRLPKSEEAKPKRIAVKTLH